MVEQYSPSLDSGHFLFCSQFVTYVMSVKGVSCTLLEGKETRRQNPKYYC